MAAKVMSIPRHGGNGSDGSDSYRAFAKMMARRAQRREGKRMLRFGVAAPRSLLAVFLEREAPRKYQRAGYAD